MRGGYLLLCLTYCPTHNNESCHICRFIVFSLKLRQDVPLWPRDWYFDMLILWFKVYANGWNVNSHRRHLRRHKWDIGNNWMTVKVSGDGVNHLKTYLFVFRLTATFFWVVSDLTAYDLTSSLIRCLKSSPRIIFRYSYSQHFQDVTFKITDNVVFAVMRVIKFLFVFHFTFHVLLTKFSKYYHWFRGD